MSVCACECMWCMCVCVCDSVVLAQFFLQTQVFKEAVVSSSPYSPNVLQL